MGSPAIGASADSGSRGSGQAYEGASSKATISSGEACEAGAGPLKRSRDGSERERLGWGKEAQCGTSKAGGAASAGGLAGSAGSLADSAASSSSADLVINSTSSTHGGEKARARAGDVKVSFTSGSPGGAEGAPGGVGWRTLEEVRQICESSTGMPGACGGSVRVKGFVRSAMNFRKNPVSLDVEVPLFRTSPLARAISAPATRRVALTACGLARCLSRPSVCARGFFRAAL